MIFVCKLVLVCYMTSPVLGTLWHMHYLVVRINVSRN